MYAQMDNKPKPLSSSPEPPLTRTPSPANTPDHYTDEPMILNSPFIPASSSLVPRDTDENDTPTTTPVSTLSNNPDYNAASRAYFERHGGHFQAFLRSCGIGKEDRQTRNILDAHQITEWTVFLHTTVDDHLHWGLELPIAQRLVRGGRKTLLALQEIDSSEDDVDPTG
ncbi:hypothetical protein PCANC_09433 [Puccinia coronata f. sp. avenae]|uniref:Uncharacterized protein n=1 Tax=Puccinia coronata f. sp. avenae TaxID=200324 RepID=A0A2N5SUE5_9BASI|nr:hypothetical protein PCANC_09433 [Puccinia coronata f. sp. avenae]